MRINQKLTDEFAKAFMEPIDYDSMEIGQKFTDEFAESFSSKIDWKKLQKEMEA